MINSFNSRQRQIARADLVGEQIEHDHRHEQLLDVRIRDERRQARDVAPRVLVGHDDRAAGAERGENLERRDVEADRRELQDADRAREPRPVPVEQVDERAMRQRDAPWAVPSSRTCR